MAKAADRCADNPGSNLADRTYRDVWVRGGGTRRFNFEGAGPGTVYVIFKHTLLKTLRKALCKCKVPKTLQPYTLRRN